MTLHWEPPTEYTDGSSLNAVSDLDSFEIFLNQDGSFSAGDSPNAAVSAADPDSGWIATSFNLANLAPFISRGVTYHVSVRAVAKNGLKSDFSPSATFSY